MKNSMEDTIAAISTPIGEGGIGIVRMSGPMSVRIAEKIFIPKLGKKLSSCKTHSISYGHIVDPDSQGAEPVDEVLVSVMRSPKTYTKEDIVEINCHGGIQATRKVLEVIISAGARTAEPGEFTKRAFLNGRLDLAQAEAVLDVIRSKTNSSLKVAMSQLNGELSSSVNHIRDELLDIAAIMEAAIDFPEEDIEIIDRNVMERRLSSIVDRLEGLSDSYGEGAIL
nr:tRNA uridine-5-carboxymethylaminomethyl(34) synthesis GTPase MnmE [Candidatus Omnitrophota bacterium]